MLAEFGSTFHYNTTKILHYKDNRIWAFIGNGGEIVEPFEWFSSTELIHISVCGRIK
jgi:hypothetical protein